MTGFCGGHSKGFRRDALGVGQRVDLGLGHRVPVLRSYQDFSPLINDRDSLAIASSRRNLAAHLASRSRNSDGRFPVYLAPLKVLVEKSLQTGYD